MNLPICDKIFVFSMKGLKMEIKKEEVDLAVLKQDVDELKNDLKEIIKNFKTSASDSADEAKNKLLNSENVEELKAEFAKVAEEIKSKSQDGADALENSIKSEPLKSVAITFGLGLIAGLFLRK